MYYYKPSTFPRIYTYINMYAYHHQLSSLYKGAPVFVVTVAAVFLTLVTLKNHMYTDNTGQATHGKSTQMTHGEYR